MVNSGFVYAISKQNQDKKIIFITKESHAECIKNIFSKYNYKPENIDFWVYNHSFELVKIIFKLYQYTQNNFIDKYVFLSYKSFAVYLVYKLIDKTPVYFVCHGELESLINNENKREPIKRSKKNLLNKIFTSSFSHLIVLVLLKMKNYIRRNYFIIMDKVFNFNSIFLNHAKENVTYIVLSKHIIYNLSKHNIVHRNKMLPITMPYIYSKDSSFSFNEKLNNFGIIGYGNPAIMKSIIEKINNLSLSNKYTFWNIGGNSSGLEGIDNLIFPIFGKPLTREEIDLYSKKLDFTLILYDKDSYQLSCSGAVFESISYLKPIIYLSNSCINEYNKFDIGLECENVKDLIKCITDIVINPDKHRVQYEVYVNNMIELRKKLDLDNRRFFYD